MNLEELRVEIDKCNKELIEVLKKRFELTRKVGLVKLKNNLKSYDKAREDVILNSMVKIGKNANLNEDMIKKIFKIIMKQAVKEHKEIKNEYSKNR